MAPPLVAVRVLAMKRVADCAYSICVDFNGGLAATRLTIEDHSGARSVSFHDDNFNALLFQHAGFNRALTHFVFSFHDGNAFAPFELIPQGRRI